MLYERQGDGLPIREVLKAGVETWWRKKERRGEERRGEEELAGCWKEH
jgi:hypothetical protein